MSPVLAGAARAKADKVVAEAWSARLDAQVGAGRRQEDFNDELDAEESDAEASELDELLDAEASLAPSRAPL